MAEKVGTSVRAHCSQCGGERNCEVVGHFPQRGGDDIYQWRTDWFLLACRGCDHVFAQTVSSNSEEYIDDYDVNGEHIREHIEYVETWPAASKRALPDWFEHQIVETDLDDIGALNASLRELYKALDADLLVLASIGIRTSFDIAAEVLGVDPKKTFQDKVTALVAGSHLLEAEKGNIEILIEAGSASAHRGWQPKASDIDALMTALEEFIYQSMVLPSRRRAQAEKLAKLGARVPKRKPKTKNAATAAE